jgi:hypothetical protein
MNTKKTELVLEEKMDRVMELLEELVLDAVLEMLVKVSDRNREFASHDQHWNCYRSDCKQRNEIPF